MNELYWISRLDGINGTTLGCSIISGIMLAISIVACCISSYYSKSSTWDSDIREAKEALLVWLKIRKYSLIIFGISLPLQIFIPTTKEALVICGVGGTIDYIKSNDKIQQLPDKCVDALDAWVESLSEDDNDTNNKQTK